MSAATITASISIDESLGISWLIYIQCIIACPFVCVWVITAHQVNMQDLYWLPIPTFQFRVAQCRMKMGVLGTGVGDKVWVAFYLLYFQFLILKRFHSLSCWHSTKCLLSVPEITNFLNVDYNCFCVSTFWDLHVSYKVQIYN